MALEYFLIFFIVALLSLNYKYEVNVMKQKKGSHFFHYLFIFTLLFFIGFRFEVGGDWSTYAFYYERAQTVTFRDYISLNEFSYAVINYLSSLVSGEILLVNIICASLFIYFLYKFLFKLPRPWLGLVVAIPYFIIVISLGYVRQGLAIAIFLYATTFIKKKKYNLYIFWLLIASSFHLSALTFLPLILLQYLQRRIVSTVLITFLITIIFYLNYDQIFEKAKYYFEFQMQSSGGFMRSLMNLLPALVFLIFYKKFRINKEEKSFWFQVSVVSVIFSILLLFYPNYTIIDRLGYYLIALQIFVFSYLPGVFGIYNKKNIFWILSIILYYFMVLLVWQLFAKHSYAWIPYNSYLFELNW